MSNMIKRTKWFWAWEYEKEEDWLNEMAARGYALARQKGCKYWFEKTEPGEYIIRTEYHADDPDYVSFMSELGAERVSYYIGWNYFRRRSSYGEFDLFSDLDSKIGHLCQIGSLLLTLGIMSLIGGIFCIIKAPLIPVYGIIDFLMGVMVFYGYGCVKTKRELMEKDKKLRE